MPRLKTSKDLSDSKITQMQELGSAWVFRRAIKDNRTWKKWEDMKTDNGTITQLKSIWRKVGGVEWSSMVDDQWLKSFYKQQKALLKELEIHQGVQADNRRRIMAAEETLRQRYLDKV